jgi:hypothetical protein
MSTEAVMVTDPDPELEEKWLTKMTMIRASMWGLFDEGPSEEALELAMELSHALAQAVEDHETATGLRANMETENGKQERRRQREPQRSSARHAQWSAQHSDQSERREPDRFQHGEPLDGQQRQEADEGR